MFNVGDTLLKLATESGFAGFFRIIADNGIDCIIFAPGPGSVWGKSHAVLFDIRFQILCFPAAQVILDHI